MGNYEFMCTVLKTRARIGDLNVELESEMIDNKPMDTKINVESGVLCFVSGEQKDQFLSRLNDLISEYRI